MRIDPSKLRRNGMIFAVSGVALTAALVLIEDWTARIAGGLVAAVALLLAALLLARARGGAAAILATQEGLQHPDLGLIPWQDVCEIRVDKTASKRALIVDVADAKRYRSRLRSSLMKALVMLDSVFHRPLLTLPQQALGRSPHDLAIELDRIRHEHADPSAPDLSRV